MTFTQLSSGINPLSDSQWVVIQNGVEPDPQAVATKGQTQMKAEMPSFKSCFHYPSHVCRPTSQSFQQNQHLALRKVAQATVIINHIAEVLSTGELVGN